MKKNLFALMAMVALVSAVATSCDDSTDNNEPEGLYDLSGDISSSMTLTADNVWTITGALIVTDGATLTIEAGTTVQAEAGFGKYILVDRGGKININGTAAAPVTMTCSDSSSQWGGLIINGYAPISGATSGSEGATEVANAYAYGGSDSADNSGSITYLKLLCTGARSSASIEHNGLTLNGVGNGTKIENVYVEATLDDAVEFFGGSVNVTNFLTVDSDDDMFDFTQGYTGTLKNCYGIWTSTYTSTEGDPRGVEADGNLDGSYPTHVDQSTFAIENMTIRINSAFEMHDAIKVRRGAKATITNALVTGSGSAPADLIDFVDGNGNAAAGTSVSVTSTFACDDMLVDGSAAAGYYTVDYATTANTGCDFSLFAWTGVTL